MNSITVPAYDAYLNICRKYGDSHPESIKAYQNFQDKLEKTSNYYLIYGSDDQDDYPADANLDCGLNDE